MNIILCGYNWTGCKALEILLKNGHNVFVYTHENPFHIPSLIDYCLEKGVPYSTENISKTDLPFKPDVICSIYYRYIIKDHIIRSCDGKIFNLHPALLPEYRGCSSLTWAMINQEENAGYTFHYIDEEVDTGKILVQEKIKIEEFDTQETLYKRAMFIAMNDFEKVLQMVINGEKGVEQEGDGSYYKRGCPLGGEIDPEWDDNRIKAFIRAMIHLPYPVATYKDEEIVTFQDYLVAKSKENN